MATHYLAIDARRRGDYRRAVCGAWIRPEQHSTTPACEPCGDFLSAEAACDAALAELAAEPVDPALLVHAKPFQSTAGYRPKGSGR